MPVIQTLVIPGRERKLANPESRTTRKRVWIPGPRFASRLLPTCGYNSEVGQARLRSRPGMTSRETARPGMTEERKQSFRMDCGDSQHPPLTSFAARR